MKFNGNLYFKSLIILVTFISLLGSGCKKEEDENPTIAQVAVSMPGFSQLEAAAIKGDLAVALSNRNANDPAGAYTVFAPTNDAFAKLGLVKPSDLSVLQKSFLQTVLLYHVNNGNFLNANFSINANVSSLLGDPNSKKIIKIGNDVYINGSKILATDVKADNGTVHVIDKVLLASGKTIAKTAAMFANSEGFTSPELSFLLEAVIYADLANLLDQNNLNVTVFAPTDQAFKDLGKQMGVALNVPSDIRKLPKATVANILATHVVSNGGKYTSELFVDERALNNALIVYGSFTNGVVSIKSPGNPTVANMVIPDFKTTNGIVHVIDKVLLP